MIRRNPKSDHFSGGSILQTSASILTGSFCRVRPSLALRRVTWVSTASPGKPKATPRTTLAVLRPTPGSVTRSSISGGTWSSKRSTKALQQPMIDFVLARKNPVGWIMVSSSAGSGSAKGRAAGERLDRGGGPRVPRCVGARGAEDGGNKELQRVVMDEGAFGLGMGPRQPLGGQPGTLQDLGFGAELDAGLGPRTGLGPAGAGRHGS